jgi:pantothenate kinase-related protein Tda10
VTKTDITITISGKPGSGKTTISQAITKHLIALGFDTDLIDELSIGEHHKGKEQLCSLAKSRKILVKTRQSAARR